ncbi:sugar ABC transporter permease [Arthrobacter sp. StoSoilB3]|jgi:multiple sugar transport system permease protein|uniref:Multiple sugar transport system permease protein n=2 Tax=Paenarthrobacter TaxID=1742992 RepID=A0ABT9THI4_PAENI|nr:sugar ABC transporter permease [Arthrobacter sp. Leaf145]MDI2022008.1 Melibiose/raffinose/stachyose import permease protein MelD [Paenarthrobacter nicotinovorans]SKB42068.1 carbohydrate ABC transporter membrane protein 1, CUT1 family (TC 3.A.1.1.-) [Arthrobacter sp. 31Cvi3.1E]BCW12000.1 sugar ABC transporter permease [Arthrobacter sp. NtRootA2]BCW16084.1 sugar ABC transporter permease [Arthrobacter sp. NtRootA4]BCW24417.1 sugar ABC transporter permease [Arthrobacter sp. NtRootC7]BCW28685.1
MTTLTKQPDPGLSAKAPRKSRKRGKPSDGFRGIGDLKVALFFIAPAMVGLILFYLVPTIRGIYLSFTEYSILGDPEWIGARNYERIAKDPLFWNALSVTAEYVVINIVLQTALALGLAILMHRVAKSTIIRGALLMPYLMANVIAALLWFWMLDYQIGIINQIIEWTGLPRVAFFGSEQWAIPTQALINTWRHMGYTALLIFAGLQAIPNSVYEAASIDGSKAMNTFWRITLPLLRPVLVLVLVVTVIGSFQVFDTVAVTTAGGPVNATRVLQFYIYQRAFNEQDFGYGSALAVILFLILAIVAFIQMKFLRGNQSDLD